MSNALQKPMSLDAFLEWEERQPVKYEFDGLHVYAMTGGSIDHARIQVNIAFSLKSRLRGQPCEPFGSDLKVITSRGVRYPDASIVCTRQPGKDRFTTDAVVVFEVLSPSTSSVDRIIKNQEYRDTASIQRYVILEQDRQAATVFSRANGDWAGHVIAGDADLELPEAGVTIPLAELYDGVDLVIDPPPPPA